MSEERQKFIFKGHVPKTKIEEKNESIKLKVNKVLVKRHATHGIKHWKN